MIMHLNTSEIKKKKKITISSWIAVAIDLLVKCTNQLITAFFYCCQLTTLELTFVNSINHACGWKINWKKKKKRWLLVAMETTNNLQHNNGNNK